MKSRFNPWRNKKAPVSSQRNKSQRRATKRLTCEVLEERRVLTTWIPSGPAPIINGGTENVNPDNQVSGAVHSVAPHPTDADTIYIGTTNGGVWKTTNATDVSPNWTPLTDHLQSLSVGDLEFDPNDPNTLIAGVGRASAFRGEGGELTGLQLTRDAGATWEEITDPLLLEREFSGVTINGDVILAASNGGFTSLRDVAAAFGRRTGGLFRSTDGGESWESIQVLPEDTDRPGEIVPFNALDLISDPTDPNRYYLSIQDEGIFKTEDAGETWAEINDGDINTALETTEIGFDDMGNVVVVDSPIGFNNNTELTIGTDGRLFVGIVENNQVEYIGYTDDAGSSWTQMDLPFTPDIENGALAGLQPRVKEGAQGLIHFSIEVDPNNSNIVYVGGDRQGGDTLFPNGNSIGAQDSVGRLFRGDVTRDPIELGFNPARILPIDLAMATQFDLLQFVSPQWDHLTHSDTVFFAPDGGTRTGSAPHADSRDMAFDANGELIEGDDGGIFRRTSPQDNTGDWFPLSGNLQTAEMHNVAYDSNSNILIGGTQDNGTVQQVSTGSLTWDSVNVPATNPTLTTPFRAGGDGGDVAVDDTSRPGFSIRYSSAQFLGNFRRQVFDANNTLVEQTFLGGLNVNLVGGDIGTLNPDAHFFVAPVELNNVDQERVMVATRVGLFESLNMADDFFIVPGTDPNDPIGPNFNVVEDQNAMVYGGFKYGESNINLTYWAVGSEVLIRTGTDDIGGVTQNLTVAQFPGDEIRDLTANTNNWEELYVMDDRDIFLTNNQGVNWNNLTGNLQSLNPGTLRSLRYIPGADIDAIVVGTDRGIYVTSTNDLGTWTQMGDSSLPNAPIYDLDYDFNDDVLVASLFGRGAWTLSNASANVTDRSRLATFTPSTVNGVVFNDLDANEYRTIDEGGVGGIRVYADSNGNGVFDVGERSTFTNLDGSFSLAAAATNPSLQDTTQIRLDLPADVEQTTQGPTFAEEVRVTNDAAVNGVAFGIRGSSITGNPGGGTDGGGGTGGGGNTGGGNTGGGNTGGNDTGPGLIEGSIFVDSNANGVRDDGESGVGDMIVYLDANDNCVIGLGEVATVTDAMGNYSFSGLATGTHSLRMTPKAGFAHDPCSAVTLTVSADGTVTTDTSLTVPMQAMYDTALDGTARHGIVEGLHLGTIVNPGGDDTDHDGVFFTSGVAAGQRETITVLASKLSVSASYLQGWIDWNGDGDFNDAREKIISNERLSDGLNEVQFNVPRNASGTDLLARFRWGFERGIGPTAEALAGEVEEYRITVGQEADFGIIAGPDTAMVVEDSENNPIDVLSNDAPGLLGGTLSITSVTQGDQGGTVVINTVDDGDDTVLYTPADNFSGTEVFTYTVSDGQGGTKTQAVEVSVTGTNDDPVAEDDSFSVAVDIITLDVLDNDTALPDVGEELTIFSVTQAANGRVGISEDGKSVTYQPNPGFLGSDSFTYQITDGNDGFDTATVTLAVSPAPALVRIELQAFKNGAPVDVDNNPLTIGDDFQLTAFVTDLSDQGLGVAAAYADVAFDSSLATVTEITSGAQYQIDSETTPNGAPVKNFLNDQGTIEESGGLSDVQVPLGNSTRELFTVDLTAIDDGSIEFQLGEASNLPRYFTLLYGRSTAVPDYLIDFVNTSVSVGFTGADDDDFTVAEDSSNNGFAVLMNDRGSLELISVGEPSNGGTAVIFEPQDGGADQVLYTPAADFNGVETFTYTVRDTGTGLETTATVTVNVTPVNDAPSARNDSIEVLRGSVNVALPVLANDTSSPDTGETLTITDFTTPSAGGTIQLSSDGMTLLYTPPSGDFVGRVSFEYTITDGNTLPDGTTPSTDTATVTVDVVPSFSDPEVNFIFNVGRTVPDPSNPGETIFEELDEIQVGDSFELLVLVQDITPAAMGAFSAYLDVLYDSGLVSVNGPINHSEIYPVATSGDDNGAGLIDELGGLDDMVTPPGGEPLPLAKIPFVATAAGVANFTGNPADVLPRNETTLFGQSRAVPSGAQVFIDDVVSIVGNVGSGSDNGFLNFENPLDVNGDGNISPIDALLVINDINLNGSRDLRTTTSFPAPGLMVDVNDDMNVSPIDVILVVNHLNDDKTVSSPGLIADDSQPDGMDEGDSETKDENTSNSGFAPDGNSDGSVDSTFSRNTIDAVLSHLDDADEEENEEEWLTNMATGIV